MSDSTSSVLCSLLCHCIHVFHLPIYCPTCSGYLMGIVLFCFALQLHTTDDAAVLDKGQFTAIPQHLGQFCKQVITNTRTTHTSRISEYKPLCVAVQTVKKVGYTDSWVSSILFSCKIGESNVVEAHGYGFRSTVVKASIHVASAIIAMYDVLTMRVFVRYKTVSLLLIGESTQAKLRFNIRNTASYSYLCSYT